MAVIMTSLKVVLFCSVAVVIFCSQETNAWGRFRIRVPRISIPRISLPRITLPRIRLPRIRLPRIRLPRIRLPRIRLSLIPFYGINTLLFPVIKLPPIKLPGSDPVCLDVNFRHLLPIGKISCDDSIPTPPSAPVVDPCSLIVSRSEWGAPSISESEHLVLPMAMIAMYLGGHNCSTRHECTEEAKSK
ncbi:hypothetical protein LSH36_20g00010 [Paralvinella palmiformis]|uniref:Uncharacterized protein n=1 Tax=Paralvinella palmiformis TaxID=53620 RepID=A0AAD9KAF9_9ANNE|nr:hypothetical protein LSH36_20g00010 [Paralvinella palmiformis]